MAESNNLFDRMNEWDKKVKILVALITSIISIPGANFVWKYANDTFFDNQNSSQEEKILKEFKVSAEDEAGESYEYKGEKPAQLKYSTSGEWKAIPEKYNKEDVPSGWTDADGYKNFKAQAKKNKPCSELETGALVVVASGGECVAAGKTDSFDAEPGKNYRFVMNDNHNMYKDNEGNLEVTLSKTH